MNVGRFALTHSRGVLAVAMFLAGLGLFATWQMPVAIIPDFPYPRIAVIADAGDMAIEAVVARITRPLEAAAAAVPRVTRVRSRSARGSVEMSVDFDWNADMFQALTYLRGSIDAIRHTLPSDLQLTIERQDPASFPIIGYSITSPSTDQRTLRELADLVIMPTLSRLDGVYRVLVQGGEVREFTVTVSPAALAANGVSTTQVAKAIEETNQVASSGRFDQEYMKYLVVGTSELRNREDILNVAVAVKGGVPVRVRDVADVTESSEEKITAVTANGQPAVLFSILKQPGASTVAVSHGIEKALDGMKSSFPPDVKVRPFYDESDLLREAIGSVRDAIIVGGILAILVLVLFLGSVRASAAVILTIPITVLISLLVLRVFGQTLNLMTLGGLAVGLGLVIDDVVVTVENIHRRVQEGMPIRQAAAQGATEIAKPLIGTSLTSVCVFLPLLAVGGIVGAFFAPLALTLTAMLVVSIVLALTAAPALCGRLMRETAGVHVANLLMGSLRRLLARWLGAALRHVWATAGVGVFLLVLTGLLFRALPTGFMPQMDEGAFILDYYMPDGTSLAETDRQCRIVERILMAQPEVDAYSRRTGMELGFFATEQNLGDMAVKLKPRFQRKRSITEVISAVREECARQVPGMRTEFPLIIQDRVGDMVGEPDPIEVKVFGDDIARLQGIAQQVGKIVGDTPGVVDEFDGIVASGPELVVRIDPSRAARAGLTSRDIIDQLSTAMLGSGETVIRRGERMIGIRVTYPPSLRRSQGEIREISLVSPDGRAVPLRSVADVAEGEGTTEQNREDQKPVVAVTAALENRDLGSAVREVQDTVAAKVELPEGYSIQYGGLYQAQQQSFRKLALVFLLGMALVLVVTVCQFEAFAEPIALLVSAAFSLVGVVLALFLTGAALNSSSFAGAIMVFGMVLRDGIILMDHIRTRTRGGMTLMEAAMESGRIRVRPVVMTSLIAILTLLPLALGIGAGAEMQKPLAIAVIGGLATTPAFALLLGPALLVIMRGKR